jgi:ketosteroid isomerase-like protein
MKTNLELVQSLYAAFAKGDVPTVLGAMTPDAKWTEAAGGPYGGVSIGPDAVLRNVFMKLGTEWDGFTAVPGKFVADGDTVIALGDYSGRHLATGKSFRARFAHVWTLRGGRVVEFEQITDTVPQLEATRG